MIEILNIRRIWEILRKVYSRESDINKNGEWDIRILGERNSWHDEQMPFDEFTEYYSFKLISEDNCLIIYNNDRIPYEDYTEDKFIYLPFECLGMTNGQIDEWIDGLIFEAHEQRKLRRLEERKNIQNRINALQKQLEQL